VVTHQLHVKRMGSSLAKYPLSTVMLRNQPTEKRASDFFTVSFTNKNGFSHFVVHNYARECQSASRKNFPPCFHVVAAVLCRISDTEVTHFTQYLLFAHDYIDRIYGNQY